MRTGFCQETSQRLPAHPDKLFLDMMRLVQLLQRRLHCTALKQKTEPVKRTFSHVTQSGQLAQKIFCIYWESDSYLFPTLRLVQVLSVLGLFSFYFCYSSVHPQCTLSLACIALQVCCWWKSSFTWEMSHVRSEYKSIKASRWSLSFSFFSRPFLGSICSHSL